MIPLPAGQNNFYVIAGTFGNFDAGIRFVHIDPAGNVLQSLLYREANHPKACFDFTKVRDNYYITCLRRDALQDRIELIEVNEQGVIMSNVIITPSPGSLDCFYPIHSIWYNNKFYICGYQTEGTGYPNMVTHTTQKKAFVLMYDPATQTVPACYRFDSYNSTNSNSGVDFDMAVRMIPTSSGQLYVTGSCNVVRPLYNPALVPLGGYNEHEFTSGTMNMLLNASNLQNSSFPSKNTPIASPYSYNTVGNTSTHNIGEHGFGMIEKNGIFYNASNLYRADSPAYYGRVPDPQFYQFTAIDPNNNLYPMGTGTKSRWQFAGFDYAWGLQTLKSRTGGDVLLAGMLNNLPSNCYGEGEHPVSIHNYNPFIADYNLGWNSATDNITVAKNYSKVYRSRWGTGVALQYDSYHTTLDWQYNNTWSCDFVLQTNFAGYDHIALTAPVLGGATSKLNFKFILGDKFGNEPSCPGSVTPCFSDNSYLMPVVVPLSSTVSQSQIQPTINYLDNYMPYVVQVSANHNDVLQYLPQSVVACNGSNNYYRLAEQMPISSNSFATISPNPAQDKINVALSGSAKQVVVSLTDMTGRVVANLYSGAATGLSQPIALPSTAVGLYFVHIVADGIKLPVEKLMIK